VAHQAERRVEWFIEQEKVNGKKRRRRNDACVVIKEDALQSTIRLNRTSLNCGAIEWLPLSIGRPWIDTHHVRNEADGLGFSTFSSINIVSNRLNKSTRKYSSVRPSVYPSICVDMKKIVTPRHYPPNSYFEAHHHHLCN
jgi:hypothetical protein